MEDWIFNNMGKVLVAVITLVLVASFVVEKSAVDERARLVAQCMDDGKKEYECRSMFKSSDSTYVPIIIPMGR